MHESLRKSVCRLAPSTRQTPLRPPECCIILVLIDQFVPQHYYLNACGIVKPHSHFFFTHPFTSASTSTSAGKVDEWSPTADIRHSWPGPSKCRLNLTTTKQVALTYCHHSATTILLYHHRLTCPPGHHPPAVVTYTTSLSCTLASHPPPIPSHQTSPPPELRGQHMPHAPH